MLSWMETIVPGPPERQAKGAFERGNAAEHTPPAPTASGPENRVAIGVVQRDFEVFHVGLEMSPAAAFSVSSIIVPDGNMTRGRLPAIGHEQHGAIAVKMARGI